MASRKPLVMAAGVIQQLQAGDALDASVEGLPTSLTAGSVVFSDGSNLSQDNANFFWDSGNARLGIGTAAPGVKLSVFPDSDISGVIGRAHIGYIGANDFAGFSHVDQNAVGSYALIQYYNGKTQLNCATGQDITFRINNVIRVSLTSAGHLDLHGNNLLNPGTGHDAFSDYVAAEHVPFSFQRDNAEAGAITIGMPVYDYDIDEVKKAKADADGTSKVLGLVSDVSVDAAATANIQFSGILTATTGQWDAITGGAGGLLEGWYYYLDESTAGHMTAAPPSTTGQYIVRIGIALSTTKMRLLLRQRILF